MKACLSAFNFSTTKRSYLLQGKPEFSKVKEFLQRNQKKMNFAKYQVAFNRLAKCAKPIPAEGETLDMSWFDEIPHKIAEGKIARDPPRLANVMQSKAKLGIDCPSLDIRLISSFFASKDKDELFPAAKLLANLQRRNHIYFMKVLPSFIPILNTCLAKNITFIGSATFVNLMKILNAANNPASHGILAKENLKRFLGFAKLEMIDFNIRVLSQIARGAAAIRVQDVEFWTILKNHILNKFPKEEFAFAEVAPRIFSSFALLHLRDSASLRPIAEEVLKAVKVPLDTMALKSEKVNPILVVANSYLYNFPDLQLSREFSMQDHSDALNLLKPRQFALKEATGLSGVHQYFLSKDTTSQFDQSSLKALFNKSTKFNELKAKFEVMKVEGKRKREEKRLLAGDKSSKKKEKKSFKRGSSNSK